MGEFLLNTDEQMIPLGVMLPFFSIFGLAIALFHTLILFTLFNMNIKPKWLLFVVYPVLLIIAGLIRPSFALVLLLFLFLSIFVMAIIGVIRSMSCSISAALKKGIKRKDPKYPLWLQILLSIGGVILAIFIFMSGPLAFFLILLIIFVANTLIPNNRSRFLKLQATLPTSKIGSMAMGLVEVTGMPEIINPMVSPIKNKTCIGYRYTIEEISSDSDGDKSYHTIQDETRCEPFYFKDETGKIEVSPDKIELINFNVDERYSNGSRRYTQYLIEEGREMLLIGKGNEENSKPVIMHEEIYDVFAIAPLGSITTWNKFKPLRDKLLVYGCFVAFLIAVILVVPIEIKDGMVVIKLGWEIFSLDF